MVILYLILSLSLLLFYLNYLLALFCSIIGVVVIIADFDAGPHAHGFVVCCVDVVYAVILLLLLLLLVLKLELKLKLELLLLLFFLSSLCHFLMRFWLRVLLMFFVSAVVIFVSLFYLVEVVLVVRVER